MTTSTTHLLLLLLILLTATITSSQPSQQQSDRIMEAMINAGDFRDFAADFLSSIDDNFGIPLSATLFIPTDFDATGLTTSSNGRLSVAYHIVPQRLSFSLLKPLSRLPTLLPGNSIVVTNNSGSGLTVDGVLVNEPDLFLSGNVAIHGVASSLDFLVYGNGSDDGALGDSLRPRCCPHRFPRNRSPVGGFKDIPDGFKDIPDGFKNNDTTSSASILYCGIASFLLVPWFLLSSECYVSGARFRFMAGEFISVGPFKIW